MTNPYYTVSGTPVTSSTGSSSAMRAEFALIAAGFALLPAITGFANRAVVVNAAGNALTVTAGSQGAVIEGPVTLSGGGTLTGTFAGNPTFSGNVSVGGTLAVTGILTTASSLGVGGAATIVGNVQIVANLGVNGTGFIAGVFDVTGDATFSGDVSANTLHVLNAATLEKTLTVAGLATLSGAVTVGANLTVTGSVTAASYVTSSDYRLKDVHGRATGTVIDQIIVHQANYKTAPDRRYAMVLAHELQAVAPHLVVGTKDALHPDGNIRPQMVDHMRLIPELVAYVQGLKAEIADLRSRNVR